MNHEEGDDQEDDDAETGDGEESRAMDAHPVFRPHAQQDVVSLDPAVRSFPPIEPFCLWWEFPICYPDEGLDPTDLCRDRPRRDTAKRPDPPDEEPQWSVERFGEAFVGKEPRSRLEITVAADEPGLSD